MKGIIPQGKPWTRSRSCGSARKFALVATFLGFACGTLLMRTSCIRSAASRGVLNLAFHALIRIKGRTGGVSRGTIPSE